MPTPRKKITTKRTTKKIAPAKKKSDDELQQIATEQALSLYELRNQAKSLSQSIDTMQDNLLDTLKDLKVDHIGVVDPRTGKLLKAARYQNTPTGINYEKLQRRLGKDVWKRITMRTVSKPLFDAAVKTGLIKETDIVACIEPGTPGKPYIKVQ